MIDSEHQIACQVCWDVAVGFHCGAYVCEACKKFFIRCLKLKCGEKFKCSIDGCCIITRTTRTKCPCCRYKKCLQLKMYGPGSQNVSKEINHMPCQVCGAPSSGYHFGAITCEGCKGFFRRCLWDRNMGNYKCNESGKQEGRCGITWRTRNACKFCRYKKCLDVGMESHKSRIGRQSNLIKHRTHMVLNEIKMAKGLPVDSTFPLISSLTGSPFLPSDTDRLRDLMSSSRPSRPLGKAEMNNELPQTSYNAHISSLSDRRYSVESDVPSFSTSPRPNSLSPPLFSGVYLNISSASKNLDSYQEPPLEPQKNDSTLSLASSAIAPYNSKPSSSIVSLTSSSSSSSSSPFNHFTDGGVHPQERWIFDQVTENSCDSKYDLAHLPQNKDFKWKNLEMLNRKDSFMPHLPSNLPSLTEFTQQPSPRPQEFGSNMSNLSNVEQYPYQPTVIFTDLSFTHDTIVDLMSELYNYLEPVFRRYDLPEIVSTMSIETIWNMQMDHLVRCAKLILSFAKKVPGFKGFTLDEQIVTIKKCMFPIVSFLLALGFDRQTGKVNLFGFSEREQVIILEMFDAFKHFIPPFYELGDYVSRLSLDRVEVSLVCALYLMDLGNRHEYKEFFLDCLESYIKKKCGQQTQRHVYVFRCLRELSQLYHLHGFVFKMFVNNPKYIGLTMPQLFTEAVIISDALSSDESGIDHQRLKSLASESLRTFLDI